MEKWKNGKFEYFGGSDVANKLNNGVELKWVN